MSPARASIAKLLVVGLVALALSGCAAGADMTGSPSHRMRAWTRATGVARSSNVLLQDAARIMKLAGGNDPTAVKTACLVLSNDAEAANTELPTPDHAATLDLSKAYSDYYSVAVDCYHDAGVPARKMAFTHALGLLSTANSDLLAATKRMQALERG
ncbi:MAG: hypothetical protein M0008_13705 [Actinomycetota bacterium]|nr:hypothetical protein [Actinomycetota bacterium]